VLAVMVIILGGHDLTVLLRSLRIRHHEATAQDIEAEALHPEER